MKLVDASGRLFGLVNVVDLLVGIFVIGLAILIAIARMHLRIASARDVVYYRLERPVTVSEIETRATQVAEGILDVDVTCVGIPKRALEALRHGAQERETNGTLLLEVLSVSDASPYGESIDLGKKRLVRTPQLEIFEVRAKVRLHGLVDNERFYYRGVPITIDAVIVMTLNDQRIVANVRDASSPEGEKEATF